MEREQLDAQLLESALEEVSEGVVIYEGSGAIVFANRTARSTLASARPSKASFPTTLGQLLESSRAAWANGTPVPLAEAPAARALRGDVVADCILSVAAANGERSWLSVRARPLSIGGTESSSVSVAAPAWAIETFTDITRDRLRDAQQEDFLRMVSHDVRTPLAALLLQAQVLQRTLAPSDRNAERVRAILKSGFAASSLISALVEMARLEWSKSELDFESVDLAEYVTAECVKLISSLEMARVQLTIEPGLIQVRLCPKKFGRVLLTLLKHALESSAADTDVDLNVGRLNSSARIQITSHGAHVLPETLQRSFDYRAGDFSRVSPHELQLDLYIASLVTKAHGGTVRVEPAAEQGTSFCVTLPVS